MIFIKSFQCWEHGLKCPWGGPSNSASIILSIVITSFTVSISWPSDKSAVALIPRPVFGKSDISMPSFLILNDLLWNFQKNFLTYSKIHCFVCFHFLVNGSSLIQDSQMTHLYESLYCLNKIWISWKWINGSKVSCLVKEGWITKGSYHHGLRSRTEI